MITTGLLTTILGGAVASPLATIAVELAGRFVWRWVKRRAEATEPKPAARGRK